MHEGPTALCLVFHAPRSEQCYLISTLIGEIEPFMLSAVLHVATLLNMIYVHFVNFQ